MASLFFPSGSSLICDVLYELGVPTVDVGHLDCLQKIGTNSYRVFESDNPVLYTQLSMTPGRVFSFRDDLYFRPMHCLPPPHAGDRKIILVVRDVRDALYSAFTRAVQASQDHNLSFAEYINSSDSCINQLGLIRTFYVTWLAACKQDNTLIVRFENIKTNSFAEIQKIASFIGIEPTPQELVSAVAIVNPDQLKDRQKNVLAAGAAMPFNHFNGGHVFGYSKRFTESMMHSIGPALDDILASLGYETYRQALARLGMGNADAVTLAEVVRRLNPLLDRPEYAHPQHGMMPQALAALDKNMVELALNGQLGWMLEDAARPTGGLWRKAADMAEQAMTAHNQPKAGRLALLVLKAATYELIHLRLSPPHFEDVFRALRILDALSRDHPEAMEQTESRHGVDKLMIAAARRAKQAGDMALCVNLYVHYLRTYTGLYLQGALVPESQALYSDVVFGCFRYLPQEPLRKEMSSYANALVRVLARDHGLPMPVGKSRELRTEDAVLPTYRNPGPLQALAGNILALAEYFETDSQTHSSALYHFDLNTTLCMRHASLAGPDNTLNDIFWRSLLGKSRCLVLVDRTEEAKDVFHYIVVLGSKNKAGFPFVPPDFALEFAREMLKTNENG